MVWTRAPITRISDGLLIIDRRLADAMGDGCSDLVHRLNRNRSIVWCLSFTGLCYPAVTQPARWLGLGTPEVLSTHCSVAAMLEAIRRILG
jgi:hypothetical protein